MSDPKVRQEDAEKDNLVIDQAPKPVEDKKLARYAGYHGAYEVAAAQRGQALFTPLEISNKTARQIPGYTAFAEQYELYKVPAHHATNALGRVNDLHQSGAPRTPAEIPAKTMKNFKPVDNVSQANDEKLKSQSANQWIEQQDELHTSFDGYMDTRHHLTSAMAEWRSVQSLLRSRKLAAERDSKSAEAKEIDEMAERLVKITEFSAEALTITVGLEKEITEGVEETYTETAEAEGKEVVQTAETSRKYKYEKLIEVAKKAETPGKVGLKELFMIGTGNYEKYQQLRTEIDLLTQAVTKADYLKEQHHIDAAWKNLTGVKIEVKGKQRAFEAKRSDSRNGAQAFGQAMNGREKTIMVAMMAEAYQELDLFGTRALDEANILKPKAQSVWNYLQDNVDKYKVEREDDFSDYADDYRRVGGAFVDSVKSRELFQTEQPKWHQAANAWRHFMSDVMGKQFDPQEADVDAKNNVKPKV